MSSFTMILKITLEYTSEKILFQFQFNNLKWCTVIFLFIYLIYAADYIRILIIFQNYQNNFAYEHSSFKFN